MTDITIRRLTRADLGALCDMIRALAAYHGDVSTVSEAMLERDCFASLPTAQPWVQILVAEEAGALLGYGALLPRAQLQFAERGMDLHHLFVRPEARGRGVGQALLQAARQLAGRKGAGFLSVGVDPRNGGAEAFYLANGFEAQEGGGRRFRAGL